MIISVLIPVHNSADTIKETVDSIVSQEFYKAYRDIEIVIANNASTDNSADIIRKYKDKRIRLYTYTELVIFPENLKR